MSFDWRSQRRNDERTSETEPTYNYVPGEYDGLSGTFANACREADREFRKQQAKAEPSSARDRGAAPSTVEALLYSLRERGVAALKEPDTKRRLSELSEEQLIEVAERLQKLKSKPWSDQEIAKLLIWRNQC